MNELIEDITSLRYNRAYRIWEPFLRKYDCQRIAEIGIREGKHFSKLIKHNPEIAVAIDLWRDDGDIARNDIALKQGQLDAQYENFKNTIGLNPCVKVIRDYSSEAVKQFQDNYFDFVYLDADHSFKGIWEDINLWYPKVKPGKFLFGDDYRLHTTRTHVQYGVVQAVSRFAGEHGLSFFVFPRSKWGIVKP